MNKPDLMRVTIYVSASMLDDVEEARLIDVFGKQVLDAARKLVVEKNSPADAALLILGQQDRFGNDML